MHFLQVQDVLEVAGKEASDKYFIHGLTLNDPEMTDTIKWIFTKGKAKYGHERLAFWIEGFDPVYVLVQAIVKARVSIPTMLKELGKKWTILIQPTDRQKWVGRRPTASATRLSVLDRSRFGKRCSQILRVDPKYYGSMRLIIMGRKQESI